MKPTYQVVLTSLKKLPALLALGCCLLANHAAAAVLYWDNNGTSTPGSGTWDTTTKNWATSSTLTTATVVWNTADAAVFTAGGTSAGSITITVNSAVPCAGMFANGVSGSACNPTFNGTGSLSIAAGLQGFFISGGFTITINVPITGAGGVEQQGGGVLSLYGNNTYTGGTEITGGQTLNYNNNNSFGTGTIIIGGNSGGLASTASTALTIPNNFSFPTPGWNLNLAGGLPVAGAPGTTFSGNFPLPTGTTTLYTGGAGQLTEISGVVGGIGATVIFSDPGTMWLAGVNTYSGNTSITNTLSGTGPNPILSIIGSGSLGSGSYSGFITNAGSFIYASSAPQTLSGVISGAGTLTVSGSGTLSLLGINTYSGATAVSAGKLAGVTGGSCAGSAVTVSSSGTLGVAITDNTKQWTCAGATFTAGTTSLDFNFNFVTPSTTLAPLNVNGAAAFTATPTVTVEAGSLPVGTYPLMTWTSTSGTAPSTVVLPPNVTGNLSLSLDGSTLLLNITATTEPLVWAVSGTGAWDAISQNWYDSGGPPALAYYVDGAAVVFDETYITAPTTVTLNGTVAPGAVGVNNSTYNYTVSGTGGIGGATGLSKQGSATLTLACANTFSGPTTIGAGTLQLGDGVANNGSVASSIADNGSLVFANPNAQAYSGVISGTGALTLAGPNSLTLNGANTYSGPTTIGTGTTLTLAGQLGGGTYAGGITDNGTLTYTGAGQTLSGIISGTGALVQNAQGTLTLSGANTFSGPVTITAATLSVNSIADSSSSALGLGTAMTLNGGTLSYSGATAATTTRAVTLSGTASVVDVPSGSLEFNSQVKTGTFTKTSAGVLTLSGSTDNSSLGVTVNAGKVVLNKTSSSTVHGVGAATTVNSGGTLQLAGTGGFEIFSGVTLTVASGGVFDANGQNNSFTKLNLAGTGISSGGALINSSASTTSTLTLSSGLAMTAASSFGGAGNITVPSVVSGAFALTKVGAGTLTLNGLNTYSGATTISAGTLTIGGTGKLTAGTYSPAIANAGTFNFNSAVSQTLSGIISGAGALNVGGGAGCILTLSGVNTFTGLLNINNGSQANINALSALGTAPANTTPNAITLNYGFLRVQTASVTLGPKYGITLGAGQNFNGGSLGGSIQVAQNLTMTIPGVITGPSAFMCGGGTAAAGFGTNVLSGANTYTGGTAISAGVLRLGANGTLPYGTTLEMAPDNASGTFFDLGGFSQTIGPLSTISAFSGTPGTGTPTIVLTGPLTVLETNINTTFGGKIVGAGGSLTINTAPGGTPGTLTLTNVNTYTGSTTISAGTLEVVAANGLASPTVTVADQAALKLDSNTALKSTAALVLNSGAPSVNLNFAGVCQIASLSLDGGATTVAPGTWGPVGSIALNTDSRLTGTGILNVALTPAAVAVASSGTPSTYGDTVTFTATALGTPTPTGSFSFMDGLTSLGTVTLDVNGQATLTTTALSAATHTITVSYNGDATYGGASGTTSQVVNKAALSVTAVGPTKTYGTALTAGTSTVNFSTIGLQNSETVTSVTLTPNAAGLSATTAAASPYTVTPSAAVGTLNISNYTIAYNAYNGTVGQATLTVSATGLLTYGDDPTNAVYSPAYAGLLNGDSPSVVTGSADYSTDATSTDYIGTNFIAHVVDTGTLTTANYSFLAGPDGSTTITNRPLWVTNALASDKPYDGTPAASLVLTGVGLTNVVNGDDSAPSGAVSLATGSAVGTFVDKNVGNNKTVTITGLALAGDLGTNYVLIQPIATASISQLALTVTATADTKGYDGTPASTGTPTITSGSIATGDTAPAWTQSFDSRNAGSRTLTPAGVVNDGNGGNNYAVTYATAPGSITAADLTVTAAADTKGYDGTPASTGTPTITSGTIATGDTAPAWTQSFDSRNAGPRTLTPAGVVNDGNGGNNYVVTYATASGSITAAALTVTAASDTKGYDGTPASTGTPTITSGTIATGDTAPAWTQSFDSRNVGPRTLTPAGVVNDGNGGNNYAVTYATTAGSITARALTVTAATDTKGYDGTAASTGTPTITSGTIASGDTAPTWTQSFDSPDVGSRTLTPAGVVSDGNGGNNYAVTYATASGSITAAGSTAALVSSLNPSTETSNVIFTATVSSTVGTPSGDVVFLANGVPFSTNTLVSGAAAASNASLPAGTNTIVAQYATQSNWGASSDTLQQVVNSLITYSQTNVLLSIVANGDATYTLNLLGTPGASYYVVSSGDATTPIATWPALSYSTNTAPNPSGQWSVVVSNAAPAFYRSVAVNPAP